LSSFPCRSRWISRITLAIASDIPSPSVARAAAQIVHTITPADPGNYLLSTAVLTAVACLAASLPARRACSIDPSEALRRE